jgi:hypothetical protein
MDSDRQRPEPFGLVWGSAMIALLIVFWFFLMLAIPLISIWDRVRLLKDPDR